MMDGFAVVASATSGASDYQPRPLDVAGEIHTGALPPTRASLKAHQAMRISTGAPMPPGANAVVMVEHTRCEPSANGERVWVSEAVSPGKHVSPVGEDLQAGALLFEAGRRLRPQDAGAAASAGVAELSVVRRPRVVLALTGPELLAPGQMPTGAQIVDSNSVVLRALLTRDGGALTALLRCGDDRQMLAEAMGDERCDLLLVSGGSSVGPRDHAPAVLAELGDLAVHGVAMRPSGPAGFGFVPRDRGAPLVVMLLPGNPVSCLCAYEFFGGPALRALGGRPMRWPHRRQRAPVAAKLVSALGRTDYLRVMVDGGGVRPLMTSGASLLSSTVRADGVVLIDDDCEGFGEGEQVEVLRYDEDGP